MQLAVLLLSAAQRDDIQTTAAYRSRMPSAPPMTSPLPAPCVLPLFTLFRPSAFGRARAMGGRTEFKDALTQRLAVMRLSRPKLDQFLRDHPHRVSPGIPQLLSALRSAGQDVFLVSGGFRDVIHPLADSVGIARDHVFANRLLFDVSGHMEGEQGGRCWRQRRTSEGGATRCTANKSDCGLE